MDDDDMIFGTRVTSHRHPLPKKTEIHLIRGKSVDGLITYAYLAVYAHRVRDLKLSLMQKTTELEDYGVILESGFGEPDEATKEYIRKTYLVSDIQESEN